MIKIVIDSTSYLPPDIIEKYDVSVVPLKVQFGDESYDETAINNADFYHRLTENKKIFPMTASPSVGEFLVAYQKIFARHPDAEILVMTISSGISSTCNSAEVAARQMPTAKITVFNSLSTVMGLGLMTITAAEMDLIGRPIGAILNRMEQMRRETAIVLTVDTLEYLKRGGRIGTAAAFLGTLLNTKPIIGVINGKLEAVDRVRTRRKAIQRLFAEFEQKFPDPAQPIQMGIMHILAESDMETLLDSMKAKFNITRFYTANLGPVIGTHLGPGAIGIGCCPAYPL